LPARGWKMQLETVERFPERVEQLFHDVCQLAPDAREGFLTDACGRDEKLRQAVTKLLDASARVDRNAGWNEPAIQNEARALSASPEDATLERYRLMERIGAGGMGVVYKAVRADEEFAKLVAIKIVQYGAGEKGHDAMLRRFRQERQILASLEHPNIARLLDGGSTPEGLPFLVMDFVDGVSIDRYLAKLRLPEREVLELFRTLCSAVSYAHQKLVVHRDLKPANILVTADGSPKLLDFGIAKLLDGSAERTNTGAGPLTPDYASPEQIRGEPVTTATDIYSLGVLLYEFLSGARPYRATTGSLDLARAICQETPAPMGSLSGRRIDEDLENIVQKALRKEPARRYASVEQFSEDLRRYMEGYPVSARADSRRYRTWKFAGRNKAPIAAAALVLLTMLGGISATAWQAHLANQRFQDVRELANAYLFEFHDAIRFLPGSTPARQLVVKRGMQYLDKLAQQRGNDTSLSRELATAYEKVGDVQGAPNAPSLGDRVGALATYRKALAIRAPLAAKAPRDEALGSELSDSYLAIGELLQYSGDLNAAAASYRKSITLLEKLANAQLPSAIVRKKLAISDEMLGRVLGDNEISNLGDTKGAMELSQKSRAILETLVAEHPADRDQRLELSATDQQIAALYGGLEKREDSAAAFYRSLALTEQLIREEPLNVMYRRQTAINNRSLALLLIRMGNLPDARLRSDRSAELFGQLAKEDPANMEAQEALADSYYSQGYVLQKGNELDLARKYYEASIGVYNAEMAKNPETLPAGLRTVFQLMADIGIKTKDAPLALRSARSELDTDDRLLAANGHNASALRNQGVAYTQIGQAHEVLARRAAPVSSERIREWREALVWHRRGLDVWVNLKKQGLLIPGYAPKLDEATRNVANCERELAAAPKSSPHP
jgi:tetratricopeptide (TPR) repeat protein